MKVVRNSHAFHFFLTRDPKKIVIRSKLAEMYQAKASEEEEEEYERKRGMSALARVGKLGGKTSKLVRQASGS